MYESKAAILLTKYVLMSNSSEAIFEYGLETKGDMNVYQFVN